MILDTTEPEKNIWNESKLYTHSTSKFNLPFIFKIDTPKDLQSLIIQNLKNSWLKTVLTSLPLRVSYKEINGKLNKEVITDSNINELFSGNLYIPEGYNIEFSKWFQKVTQHIFDLDSNKPLWLFSFLKREGHIYFSIVFHHIITDALSYKKIFDKFSAYYNDNDINIKLDKNELISQAEAINHYIKIEQDFLDSNDYKEVKKYYKQLFKNNNVNFPYNVYKVQHNLSNRHYLDFKNIKLNKIYEKYGVTNFIFLMAVFLLSFTKFFNIQNLTIWYPYGKRPKGLEDLLGFYVRLKPIIIDSQKFGSFIDLLTEIKKQHEYNLKYWAVGLKEIKNICNNNQINVDNKIIFSATNFGHDILSCNLQYECIKVLEIEAQNDFIFYYDFSKQNLSLCLESKKNIIDDNIAEEFLLVYKRTFSHFIQDITASIKDFSLSSVNLYTHLDKDYSLIENRNDNFKNVLQVIENNAFSYPNLPALKYKDKYINYDDLCLYFNNLARVLIEKGVSKQDYIVILLPKSDIFLISVLGILKAGAIYIPVDLEYPQERIRYILDKISPSLIITTKKFDFTTNYKLFYIEDIELKDSKDKVNIPILPTDSAYIIFTSGSTGSPKGVIISHQSLSNLAEVQGKIMGIKSQKNILQFASISFDASVSEWVTTLYYAGTLVIPACNQKELAANVINICNDNSINIVTLPPSLLDIIQPEQFVSLETVLSAGEKITYNIIEKWSDKVKLFNAYGPTEGTVCTSMKELNPYDSTSNIGQPICGVQVYIIDKHKNILPKGAVGELVISGINVAKGYIGNSSGFDNYNNTFRLYYTGDNATLDGNNNIHFIGRSDRQVKVRGYRIDLEEVENIIKKHPLVKNCYCDITESETTKVNELISIIQIVRISKNNILTIKNFIKSCLPAYMVPIRNYFVKNYVLNINGKIDIKETKRLYELNPIKNLTDNNTNTKNKLEEEKIYTIWKDILHLQQVTESDDFFDCGGDSLLVAKLVQRVQKEYNTKIPIMEFFKSPTLAFLRSIICSNEYLLKSNEFTEEKFSIEWEQLVFHKDNILTGNGRKVAFITGATGLIGTYLLNELLKHNYDKIYCLIREKDIAQATNKINASFAKYKISIQYHDFKKIKIVLGDLTHINLGISEQDLEAIVNEVTDIFHCGAHVNHIYSYDKLYLANVQSTKEIIKFAQYGIEKKIHYISALSAINDYQDDKILEEFPLNDKCNIEGGYNQTKWVSEKVLSIASKQGLKVNIYRLPTVWEGRDSNYHIPTNDHQSLLIKSFIYNGLAPNWQKKIIIFPADYVAMLIASIASNDAFYNKVYNLIYDEAIWSLTEFLFLLRQNYSISIKLINIHEWLKGLKDISNNDPIYSLLPLYLNSSISSLDTNKFNVNSNSIKNFYFFIKNQPKLLLPRYKLIEYLEKIIANNFGEI